DWPPHSGSTAWFLGPRGGLAPEALDGTAPGGPGGLAPEALDGAAPEAPGSPGTGGPDRFRYDPADPTPSPGGPLLTREAGRTDNRAVEARPDVLVYTGAVLDADVEVIGPVSALVHLTASAEFFDVFVRVCDVAPDGRSENLTDGLVRVLP